MLVPFLARAFLSTLTGMVIADVLRPQKKETEEVAGLDSALRYARVRRLGGIGSEFSPIPRDPLDAVHSSLRLPGRGHYVPPDLLEAEETLRDLELAINGFGRLTAVQRKGNMSEYDIVGADLMFGAASDSDVLEALSISGDGSSEIIGGDIGAEIIGAVAAAAARGNPKAKAALAKIAMRNAGAVVKNDLRNRRRYPLGFVPTEVDAGDSATIPAAPQNLFRAERLVIPSDIAFDFGVQDIKVGNQSQLAQSVEVPAAVFTEVSIDTNVTFDTAEIGNQISVLVRNKGSEDDVEFTAAALGTIAKS